MLFGAHVSVAGGLHHAPLNAAKIGCEVFQFFSRSPQGGVAPKITSEMADAFHANVRACGLKEWVIHAPYYINFASGKTATRASSTRIVREELERGSLIGARYVMFHPGSAKDVGQAMGLAHVIEGIKKIYDGYTGTTELLVEISAGAGAIIGDTFEDLAAILDGVGHPKLGVCFDTQHAFAGGYDLRSKKTVTETFRAFDSIIGLARLKMSHCNDSKVDLGARKDRHEHIGSGHIGLKGFEAIVRHPLLKKINFYLETESSGVVEDLKKLKKLRGKT